MAKGTHSSFNKQEESVKSFHIRSYGSARRNKLSQACERMWLVQGRDSLLNLDQIESWVKETSKLKFVEIGCGMGEATLYIAFRNPSYDYLAIDVYRPGLARIMRESHKLALNNLKLLEGDAMVALEKFPQGSLSGLHIFFPDPWPKARHHKRRLIRGEILDKMALALRKGGYIYFVSDWQEYAEQALVQFELCSWLRQASCTEKKVIDLSLERPLTRFEKKGLDRGHEIYTLCFVRR